MCMASAALIGQSTESLSSLFYFGGAHRYCGLLTFSRFNLDSRERLFGYVLTEPRNPGGREQLRDHPPWTGGKRIHPHRIRMSPDLSLAPRISYIHRRASLPLFPLPFDAGILTHGTRKAPSKLDGDSRRKSWPETGRVRAAAGAICGSW